MADAGGILFPVVGPSGAGKDTLLAGAARHLATDPRFLFVERTITRAYDAGGEAHRALDEAAFAREEQAGCFALSWRAHDLAYGIPIAIDAARAAGRNVVVNLSRAVLAAAAARYERLCILHVTAPIELLRGRLAARHRETSDRQAARITRAAAIPADLAVVEIRNDSTVAAGVQQLVDALYSAVANGAR